MPNVARHTVRAAALLAAVFAAACGGHAAAGDATLKRDLEAASGDGLALAPRGSATQVVSAVELGDGKVNPAGAPTPANAGAPAPRAAVAPRPAAPRAAPVRIIERVRIVEREVAPRAEPARAPKADPTPAVAAAPEPAPSEPAPVAVPSPGSRQLPQPVDGRAHGRRRPWDMGDVIRNAPFPINP